MHQAHAIPTDFRPTGRAAEPVERHRDGRYEVNLAESVNLWKLDACSAVTMQVVQAGVLRIEHGRVWLTVDQIADGSSPGAGDHFLSRGQGLVLQPGQRLVMEPFGIGHASPAFFAWEPMGQAVSAKSAGRHARPHMELARSWADLRQAAVLAARAMAGLARGLAAVVLQASEAVLTRIAMVFVAGRSGTLQ
jgi:hypothetical protein